MNQELGTSPAGQVVTPTMVGHLRGTRPWVLLFSILMYCGAVLTGLIGIFMMIGGSRLLMLPPAGGFVLGIFYLVIAAVYFYPATLLFRYAGAIGTLLRGGGVGAMEAALGHQRSFWRFLGVLTIAFFIFYAILIAAAVVFGFFSGSSGSRIS